MLTLVCILGLLGSIFSRSTQSDVFKVLFFSLITVTTMTTVAIQFWSNGCGIQRAPSFKHKCLAHKTYLFGKAKYFFCQHKNLYSWLKFGQKTAEKLKPRFSSFNIQIREHIYHFLSVEAHKQISDHHQLYSTVVKPLVFQKKYSPDDWKMFYYKLTSSCYCERRK